MLTLCWAAKGGSGTTVTAAGLALSYSTPTLLVDLAGAQPLALGLPGAPPPGVADWLAADASSERLAALELSISERVSLLPRGGSAHVPGHARWGELAARLAGDPRSVVVDAGTGPPPPALAAVAHTRLLVVRNCYLNLMAAVRHSGAAPTGVILVEEPGRRLGVDDLEHHLGVPVVAVILLDPAIARAVDAGLLLSRIPAGLRRPLAALPATTEMLGEVA